MIALFANRCTPLPKTPPTLDGPQSESSEQSAGLLPGRARKLRALQSARSPVFSKTLINAVE